MVDVQVANVAIVIASLLYCLGFAIIGIWALVVPVVAKVLLVYSNTAFFMPAIKAFQLNRETMAPVYIYMMFASSFYHACDNWTGACVLPANLLRKQDFFLAQLIIVLTALYLIPFEPRWAFIERWLIIITCIALFLVEATMDEPFIVQVIIAGASAALVIGYWIGYALTGTKGPRFPTYDWESFAMGIALLALACVLFATQRQWHLGYAWIHSIWHTLAAYGQMYILMTRKAAPRNAAMDALLKKNVH